MRLVIDDKIPYLKGLLDDIVDVVYLPGGKISSHDLKDADALFVRTRTLCNKDLLAGSTVKFIASATIGHDHIDKDYCKKNNIYWTNAPGCNSSSVEQYICASLLYLHKKRDVRLKGATLGVIGVGNVGSKVVKIGELLGMTVLKNDPPRAEKEGNNDFVSLSTIIQQSDVITCHVPLVDEGRWITRFMIDESFFSRTKEGLVFINSSRGEVVNNLDLLSAIRLGGVSHAILDVWENEPNINRELLQATYIGTPHIAGYSRDGKANGSRMSVKAFCDFFKIEDKYSDKISPEEPTDKMIKDFCAGDDIYDCLYEAVLHSYDIERDSNSLKNNPLKFEQLRGDYPLRREFPAYHIKNGNIGGEVINILGRLGFND